MLFPFQSHKVDTTYAIADNAPELIKAYKMPNFQPELDDWEEIIELSGGDNAPSQGKARAKAAQKEVLAVANLASTVFMMQKHVSQRLDTLNERLDSSSRSAEKLAKWTTTLTIALVIATIIQAIAAVAVALKG